MNIVDLIANESSIITISRRGYIKRTAATEYRAQKRGGKGIKGAKSEEEDPIEHIFAASTHDYLLFFTTRGMVHWRKVHQLPALSRESRGRAIINIVPLEDGENVAACRAIRNFDEEDHFLLMVPKNGLVKKTPLSAYGRPRSNGIIAVKLKEDDEIIDVLVAKKGDEIVLSTVNGMAIRFRQSDARPMGRNTSGVKGISLTKGDSVVGMVVADPEATLLTACEKGYGKRTDIEDYRITGRGGKGVKTLSVTEKTGALISIKDVTDENDLMIITKLGITIRMKMEDVRVMGRATQGVRLIKVRDKDDIASVAKVPKVDEEEEDLENGEGEENTDITNETDTNTNNESNDESNNEEE